MLGAKAKREAVVTTAAQALGLTGEFLCAHAPPRPLGPVPRPAGPPATINSTLAVEAAAGEYRRALSLYHSYKGRLWFRSGPLTTLLLSAIREGEMQDFLAVYQDSVAHTDSPCGGFTSEQYSLLIEALLQHGLEDEPRVLLSHMLAQGCLPKLSNLRSVAAPSQLEALSGVLERYGLAL
eukprot:gene4386-6792_t